MAENDNKQSEIVDFELARRIRDLDAEMQPERDLWMGIERQILDYPQSHRGPGNHFWMPYAVAASLLIAVSALLLNVFQVLPARSLLQTDLVTLDQMQREYVQVRNPMVEEFSRVNASLDQRTLNELYRNLEIMELARKDLERQVLENPENHRLVEMLMKVHEQELELLKQDFSAPSRSM